MVARGGTKSVGGGKFKLAVRVCTDIRPTCHDRQARRERESIRGHSERDMAAMSSCQKIFPGWEQTVGHHDMVEPVRSELAAAGDRSGYAAGSTLGRHPKLPGRIRPGKGACPRFIDRMWVRSLSEHDACSGQWLRDLAGGWCWGPVHEAIPELRGGEAIICGNEFRLGGSQRGRGKSTWAGSLLAVPFWRNGIWRNGIWQCPTLCPRQANHRTA